MIREAGQRSLDRENLGFAELPVSKEEVRETVQDMDSFREEQRNQQSERDALTSDEA